MEIKALCNAAYKNARKKGFYATFGEQLMLIVTELAEVLEEYRNHRQPTEVYFNEDAPTKPEGIPIELADAVIRIADMCGRYNIDLESAIKAKMRYNRTRKYRHGGKRL